MEKLPNSDWLRKEYSSSVTRVQITNSFWLAENTKETTKNQSKFKKMAMVFRKRRFDFVSKATIEKLLKNIPKTRTQ